MTSPSRIGVLLKLERNGYSQSELRMVAEYEDWLVENILTTEDLAYSDDDLETLVLHAKARSDGTDGLVRSGFD